MMDTSFDFQESVDRKVARESIRNYAQVLPFLAFTSWVAGVGIVYLGWNAGRQEFMSAWLAALSALFVYRIFRHLRLIRTAEEFDTDGEKIEQIILGALHGGLWGWTPFLFGEIGLDTRLLLYCLICSFCGLGVMISGFNPAAYSAFVVSALTPLQLDLLLRGTTHDTLIALLMALAGIAILITVRRQRVATHNLIRLQLHNHAIASALEAKNEMLVRANEGKSRLIAAASHDLRQPVYGLTLMINKMRERCRLHNKDVESVCPVMRTETDYHEIERALQQLAQSIGNLLDLSRLEAGAISVEKSNVSLNELFTRLAFEYTAQAETKSIALRVRPTQLHVKTDYSLLQSILSNLLSNAISYSDGGKILVGARRHGETCRIYVMDQGTGIAPELVKEEKLFQEYYRATPNLPPASGAGLGLAIADRFAKSLGSKIDLSSNLGRGSSFSIVLPLCSPPEKRSMTIFLPGGAATPGFGGIPVMLVTDSPENSSDILQLLEDNDALVCCSTTMMEAFVWAKKNNGGIVILDLPQLRSGEINQDWSMAGRIANISNALLIAVMVDKNHLNGIPTHPFGIENCRAIDRSSSPLKLKSILLRAFGERSVSTNVDRHRVNRDTTVLESKK